MEKTDKPLFTIITSTLNVIDTIERCVKSVAEQTFRDYEHIIVDGASTDGTVEFLNLKRDYFSVLISEPDTGIYNAWNKALKHARGEWVLFLGADDILANPYVLSDVAVFITENKAGSGIVYGDVMMVSKGNYLDWHLDRVDPADIGKNVRGEIRPLLPCHSGIFHHRDLLNKYGPFDESYRICADAKLLLNALYKEHEQVLHLSKMVYKMSLGGVCNSISTKATEENIRLLNELDIPFSLFWAKQNLLKARLKLLIVKIFGVRIANKLIDCVRFLKVKVDLKNCYPK